VNWPGGKTSGVLVIRGTKKRRERVKGPVAGDGDASTTVLGDWFATALFWRPQVALLVNRRTLLPVFTELAPAATLVDRVPAAIETILREHGISETFLAAELDAMNGVTIAPTNDRSTVGVMNEFAMMGDRLWSNGLHDLVGLSLRLAHTVVGPLRDRTGFPDRELVAVAGAGAVPDNVIALPRREPSDDSEAGHVHHGRVFQLKVTLLETKPPVWRRVLVEGERTLDHLHDVIQAAFGWWNYHLHEFEIGRARYGVPEPDGDWDPPRDERRTRIDAVAKEGTPFQYTYDFGDGWQHRVVVENVLPKAAGTRLPACVDGRRACPPEDCGGPWGYQDLLSILSDPKHPEHDERIEWLGGPFDADAFEPNEFEDNLAHAQRGGT
jgi:hypothetical protein